MAFSVTKLPKNPEVTIISGKYLAFNLNFPVTEHPGLIKPDSVLDNIAYEMAGCQFPNLESEEAQSKETLKSLQTLIDGHSQLYFADRAGATLDVFETKDDRVVNYKWINGLIFDSTGTTQLESTTQGYFPVYGNGDSVYFIYDQKVYTLSLADPTYSDPETPDITIPKYVISTNPLEIADSELEFIKNRGGLINETIVLDNLGSDPSIFANDGIDGQMTKSGQFPIRSQFTYRLTVKAGILNNTGSSSITTDDAQGNPVSIKEGTLNVDFISEGLATYRNNKAIFTPSATKGNLYLDKYFNDLADEHAIAVKDQAGIWSNEYWKSTIKDNGFPLHTSFTSMNTYVSCPYRYFTLGVQGNRGSTEYDKASELLGTLGSALVLGIISHRYGEDLIISRFQQESASVSDAQLEVFKQAAISNLLGQNLDRRPYDSFTIDDTQAINNTKKTEYIKLMNKMLDNVNKRSYVSGYNQFLTEVHLTNIHFNVLNEGLNTVKKRFNVSGYIDGVMYNTTTEDLAIFDLKSNQKKYKSPQSKGFNETHKMKRAQIVWYLACVIKKGFIDDGIQSVSAPLRIGGEIATSNEDIRTVLGKSSIRTFYDFMRFDNSSSLVEIEPAERQELWDFILETLEKMADSIVSFEETGAVNQFTTIQKNCNYCGAKHQCPSRSGVQGEVGASNNFGKYTNRIKPLIQSRSIQQDESSLEIDRAIPSYLRLARLGKDDAKVRRLTQRTATRYKKRKRDISGIDKRIKTQIGAVYITSPVTAISMVDSKRHGMSRTLRSMYPSVHRTQGSEKQVVIKIRFDSAETINSEMRHIMAQCYASPYVSIRNADLSRMILPFDTNKDIYYGLGDPEVKNLTNAYIKRKGISNRVDYGENMSSQSTSYIKDQIYQKARLFYSVSEVRVSPVPDMTDTIDLILRVLLMDSTVVSANGGMEYLIDTHSVFLQLAYLENSDRDELYNPNGVPNALFKLLNDANAVNLSPEKAKNPAHYGKIDEIEIATTAIASFGENTQPGFQVLDGILSIEEGSDFKPYDRSSIAYGWLNEITDYGYYSFIPTYGRGEKNPVDWPQDLFPQTGPNNYYGDSRITQSIIEYVIRKREDTTDNTAVVSALMYGGNGSIYCKALEKTVRGTKLPRIRKRPVSVYPERGAADLIELEHNVSIFSRINGVDIMIARWNTGEKSSTNQSHILCPIYIKNETKNDKDGLFKNKSSIDVSLLSEGRLVDLEAVWKGGDLNPVVGRLITATYDHPGFDPVRNRYKGTKNYIGQRYEVISLDSIALSQVSNNDYPWVQALESHFTSDGGILQQTGSTTGRTPSISAEYDANLGFNMHADISTNRIISGTGSWNSINFSYYVNRIELVHTFDNDPNADPAIIALQRQRQKTESVCRIRGRQPSGIYIDPRYKPNGSEMDYEVVIVDIITIVSNDQKHYLSFPYIAPDEPPPPNIKDFEKLDPVAIIKPISNAVDKSLRNKWLIGDWDGRDKYAGFIKGILATRFK